jgi:hypothetical protein
MRKTAYSDIGLLIPLPVLYALYGVLLLVSHLDDFLAPHGISIMANLKGWKAQWVLPSLFAVLLVLLAARTFTARRHPKR